MNNKHPFFWVVLITAVVVACLYIPVGKIVYRYGTLTKDLGWTTQVEAGNFIVRQVDPGGYASGKLQNGDRVLAINGKPIILIPGISKPPLIIPDETYKVTVLRHNATFDYTLNSKVVRNTKKLLSILTPIASSLVFFLSALIIGLAKPDQQFTRLFSFTWFSVGLIYMAIALMPIQKVFGSSELNLYVLLWTLSFSPLSFVTAYHFCYRFPPGVPEGRCWSLFGRSLYLCAGFLATVFTFNRLAFLFNFKDPLQFFATHQRLSAILDRSSEALMVISLLAICSLVVRNHIQIREMNQRRQLRWVLFGILAGTLPGAICIGLKFIFNSFPVNSPFIERGMYYLTLFANVALELVPISIGYAIIRHRMFNINVYIRQSLRYLLAKNVLRILMYLPAAILIYTIFRNRDRSITEILFSNWIYIFLAFAALIGLKFRNELSSWLDRKFFREAYNSEKILVSMIEEIRSFNSISEMSKWVTLQLDSALHPKQVLVFYRTKSRGDLTLSHSSSGEFHDLYISRDSKLLSIMESVSSAHEFPSKETSEIPPNEQEWLKELGIHLMVPMQDSERRLIGLLMLGEKKSEEPYTPMDRKMLEAVAGQIAMICENLLLKEHVQDEMRIKREVLSHLSEQKRNLVKECPECRRCYDSGESNCAHDQTELVLSLPVDRIIDGKYRLDKLLGRGGMGAVYQATDLGLNREVAIKVLIGSMFGDRQALRRFEREARASASLDHPNIITVYDFGEVEGEGAYLVMELLHGFTLRSVLNESGNLDPKTAAGWFDQILEGMKVAHQNGIIHRDLKPENILLARKDENHTLIKLLDFGLAKTKFMEPVESKGLTAPGTILGTLHYMSPEQIMGNEVDERTDIFSIGVMVIEVLTGKQPFTGETSSEVALAIIQRSFDLEGESQETKNLNAILQKCIAKNRNNRYESIENLQKDLIDAIGSVPPFPQVVVSPAFATSRVETRIVF